MKLHWSPRSPFVRKVMVAAIEKGIHHDWELVRSVVPTDDFSHPIFLDNPLGKIPTLVTDDGAVWHGSSVILEKLDVIQPDPRMFPTDPSLRAETRCREAFGDGIMEFMVGWIMERFNPSQRSETVTARMANKFNKSLDYLEQHIDRFKELDAAAVSTACALSYLDFRFANLEWRKDRPRAAGWYARFNERPSMLQTQFKDG